MVKWSKRRDRIFEGPRSVRWRDFVKAAEEAGFTFRKARRGTGYVFERESDQITLAVHKPHGNKSVDPAAVAALLKVMRKRKKR